MEGDTLAQLEDPLRDILVRLVRLRELGLRLPLAVDSSQRVINYMPA